MIMRINVYMTAILALGSCAVASFLLANVAYVGGMVAAAQFGTWSLSSAVVVFAISAVSWGRF